MPHTIHFWRVKDFRGRWYKTRYRTDEASIRIEHPEAECIEASSLEIPDVPVQMFHPSFGAPSRSE